MFHVEIGHWASVRDAESAETKQVCMCRKDGRQTSLALPR